MTDRQFLSIINKIAAEKRLRLPVPDQSIPAPVEVSAEAMAAWAAFLESCVKRGLKLADDHWSRLVIEQDKPVTVFALEGTEGTRPDPDFSLGLHLLMRMLERNPSK